VNPPPSPTQTAVRLAVLEAELHNLAADVTALKRAFYTFAISVVGSAVLFAFTVFALLGQSP
jgi:hypothetical protein